LGGHVAEMETGGIRVNIVPKSGGNRYTGSLFGSYTNSALQGTNLTDAIKAAGLTIVDRTNYISDFNPSGGGAIVRDRLWFSVGFRDSRTLGYSSLYQDTNAADWTYTPDRSRNAGANDQKTDNGTLRLTWQASSKDKIGLNA